MLQDVPARMDLTPLHQRGAPECLGHGRVEGLRAIDDHQQAPVGAQPAAAEGSRAPQTVDTFSGAPSHRPSAVFRAHFIDAEGDNDTVSTHVHAINQQPHQVQRVGRLRAPESVRDKASTELLLVPRVVTWRRAVPDSAHTGGSPPDQASGDHAPVQRVRIRECPGRWLAGAPRTGPTATFRPPHVGVCPVLPGAQVDAHTGPTAAADPLSAWLRVPSGQTRRPAPGVRPTYQ